MPRTKTPGGRSSGAACSTATTTCWNEIWIEGMLGRTATSATPRTSTLHRAMVRGTRQLKDWGVACKVYDKRPNPRLGLGTARTAHCYGMAGSLCCSCCVRKKVLRKTNRPVGEVSGGCARLLLVRSASIGCVLCPAVCEAKFAGRPWLVNKHRERKKAKGSEAKFVRLE